MEVKEYKSYEEVSDEDKAKYFGDDASGMINWCLMDRRRVNTLIAMALNNIDSTNRKTEAQDFQKLKQYITEGIENLPHDLKR
jgi:hypothetical protein